MYKSKQSISVSEDRVTEQHSLRRGTLPKSADASLKERNRFILAHDETYQEIFNAYFEPYIESYNAKQKRKDRRWDFDYWKKLKDGGQVEPISSFVIQIGNRDSTCAITDVSFDAKVWKDLKENKSPQEASEYVSEHINTHPNVDTCADILEEVAKKIPEWFPNFVPVSLVIHMDEPSGTPHLDCNGFFVASKNKRGLEKRCAKEAALKEMGYDGKAFGSPFKDWQHDFIEKVSEVSEGYGIEREIVGSEATHKDIATYRIEQERAEAAVRLKDLKRRAELARENEVAQMERIDEMKEEEKELEKKIKRTKKVAKKEEAKAKKFEERAEKAEQRLEIARENLQDVRDDIHELEKIQSVLEDEIEDKKKKIASWEKRIKELEKRFQELTKQVKELEQRCSKYAKALIQMSWVPELYQHPIKSFLRWLGHRIGNAGTDAKQEEIIAKEVLENIHEDFVKECGVDVQRELREYVKNVPDASNEAQKAATRSAQPTRDISFVQSGNGRTYIA